MGDRRQGLTQRQLETGAQLTKLVEGLMSGIVKVIGAGIAMASLALAGCNTERGNASVPAAPGAEQTVTVTAPAVTVTPTSDDIGPGQVATPTGLEDPYLSWAQKHQVGDKLPQFAIDDPMGAKEFAMGYCKLLGDSPIQSADLVVVVIKEHYNGSTSQSLALLEQAVTAYCPEKSRYLD